jgi:SAM-dependent methyltransferase
VNIPYNMRNEWDRFFVYYSIKIFEEKKHIIDIGGTLGLRPDKSNRVKGETEFLLPYFSTVDYKVLDKVADFNPDIVGDIHDLPLKNDSVDAIFCCSVIEHVENPIRAVEEVCRVLKPGGYALFYAPFLFYYHPMPGYYGDFYRFTYDGWEYLTRQFSTREISRVHGPFGTLLNLIPRMSKHASWLKPVDSLLRPNSRQVSGYNVFCVK